MAEVVGVISSGIAIAGLAGSLANASLKSKHLWDQFKDVPEEIRWITSQIELLEPLVAEMEASFAESPVPFARSGTSTQCIKFFNDSLKALENLAEDIRIDLNSALRSRRIKARAKMVMKNDDVQRYHRRLVSAFQILSMCQQIYTLALIRLQPQLLAAELETLRQMPTQVTPDPSQEPTQESNQDIVTKPIEGLSNTCLIPWRRPGALGSVSWSSKTTGVLDNIKRLSRIKVQLPLWLANQIWDIHVRRTCLQMNITVRVTGILKDPGYFYDILKEGSFSDLRKALVEKEQTLFDCQMNGNTILHMAIMSDRYDIAIELLEAGLSYAENNAVEESAFAYACIFNSPKKNWLDFLEYIFLDNTLDQLMEFHLSIDPTVYMPAIGRAIWRYPAALNLFSGVFKLPLPRPLWEIVPWKVASPSVLLHLFQQYGYPDQPEFITSSINSDTEHIETIFSRYFRFDRWKGFLLFDDANEVPNWRKLCRLAFRHVPLSKLSMVHTSSSATALANPLILFRFGCNITILGSRYTKKVLQLWLEDLQFAGIDLNAYGEREQSMLPATWSVDPKLALACSLPCLYQMDYGPDPKDWILHWDFFGPEYAAEFWRNIEYEIPTIPGSWAE